MGLLLPKKNARSGDRYQTDDVGLGNRVLNGSTSAVHLSFYSLFFLALDFFLSFCFDVPKFAESTSPFALLFGSVRFGLVWFGLVWFGLATSHGRSLDATLCLLRRSTEIGVAFVFRFSLDFVSLSFPVYRHSHGCVCVSPFDLIRLNSLDLIGIRFGLENGTGESFGRRGPGGGGRGVAVGGKIRGARVGGGWEEPSGGGWWPVGGTMRGGGGR